jgi:hypothetical protein
VVAIQVGDELGQLSVHFVHLVAIMATQVVYYILDVGMHYVDLFALLVPKSSHQVL